VCEEFRKGEGFHRVIVLASLLQILSILLSCPSFVRVRSPGLNLLPA